MNPPIYCIAVDLSRILYKGVEIHHPATDHQPAYVTRVTKGLPPAAEVVGTGVSGAGNLLLLVVGDRSDEIPQADIEFYDEEPPT